MRASLLMNCLWYEDISPEDLANALELTPEALFRKIFQEEDFTLGEIKKISAFVGLTEKETDAIFFDGMGGGVQCAPLQDGSEGGGQCPPLQSVDCGARCAPLQGGSEDEA